MLSLVRSFFPLLYQGASKRDSYFEGWYFKQTSKATAAHAARTVSFIPGISRSGGGDRAFVQVIDGASGMTRFFPFAVEEFSVSDSPFEVRVGGNRFSLTGLSLALEDEDGRIDADLRYGPITPIRRSFLSPGIMGPFSFVPFMECYHGVGSLDHEVDGSVSFMAVDGSRTEPISFDGARGYLEKDWGRSMPSSWVWIQSNSFDPAVGPASLFFSLARIPWLGHHFNGFLCVLYAGGVEYRFATYTGARLELLEMRGQSVRILLTDAEHKVEVQVRRNREGTLAAPVRGAMDRRIAESADSCVRVILKTRHGASDVPVFDSVSSASGVELVGDVGSLAP
ncbi:MAG: hypothetical protein JXM71_07380 [Spirochaetales bacterium]|nr:hypothetical protein [Spirochaetales bacterium]